MDQERPLKKTPLERAIAQQTDRRARYDQRMIDAGFKRMIVWAPEQYLPDLRVICEQLRAREPEVVKAVESLSQMIRLLDFSDVELPSGD